jgi:hypothetical protein
MLEQGRQVASWSGGWRVLVGTVAGLVCSEGSLLVDYIPVGS